MKKFLYMMILFAAFLPACNQEVNYPYQGKDRVHFKHYTMDSVTQRRYYYEKVYFTDREKAITAHNISMGFIPDEITKETIKIPVELLGRVSDVERTYRVEIIPGLTTAVAGEHYEPFEQAQKFAPGGISDTLRIVVNREALSSNFRDPEITILALRIVPSDDFDTGLTDGVEMAFILANYLTEPDWWSSAEGNWDGQLAYFHPLKWKILISFDEKFANYTSCPYDINNGRRFTDALRRYLEDNVVVDEYTNERLYMTSVEDYVTP